MKSLRALLNAEIAFQSTTGKGEYGDLNELRTAGLIDDELASGVKNGYRFTVVIKKSTLSTHPAIDLVARPGEYGKNRRRAFYVTESGVMMTSEEKDAPLTSMRPFATVVEGKTATTEKRNEAAHMEESSEEEIAGDISAHETAVIASLVAIHTAEMKFVANAGAGAYGTLEQLEKAGLIDKAQSVAMQRSYLLEVSISLAKAESPATFSVSAVPKTYGMSGRSSFFMDQTGVIRGADKEGGPADAADPMIR